MKVENFLKFPVRNYMERSGFRVWYEVPFMGKVIDLACLKSRRTTVSVEAKIRGFNEAIYQASVYRLWSDHSYVAVPLSARLAEEQQAMLRKEGIGLMRVSGGRTPHVVEEIRPKKNDALVTSRKRELIEVLVSSKGRGAGHA